MHPVQADPLVWHAADPALREDSSARARARLREALALVMLGYSAPWRRLPFPMRSPIYLAVEGVIGVGKTTLARKLHPALGASLLLEVFEDNPFLPLFYEQPDRYAFHTQVVFLLSRYDQQRLLHDLLQQRSVVSDYFFAKDRIFARMNLQGAEWETYAHLHRTLADHILLPDLVIYLRATVDTLMTRIAKRGRPYERAMPRDYIAHLAEAYDHFFERFEGSPVLPVETDALDLVGDASDFSRVLDAVHSLLRAQEKDIARPPA